MKDIGYFQLVSKDDFNRVRETHTLFSKLIKSSTSGINFDSTWWLNDSWDFDWNKTVSGANSPGFPYGWSDGRNNCGELEQFGKWKQMLESGEFDTGKINLSVNLLCKYASLNDTAKVRIIIEDLEYAIGDISMYPIFDFDNPRRAEDGFHHLYYETVPVVKSVKNLSRGLREFRRNLVMRKVEAGKAVKLLQRISNYELLGKLYEEADRTIHHSNALSLKEDLDRYKTALCEILNLPFDASQVKWNRFCGC